MLEKILQWDRDAFIYLNNLGIEDHDFFWSTATNITTWIPLFVFFFVIIFLKYPKREAFFVTLTVILLVLSITYFTHLTKVYVARLRPNNNEEINTLIRIIKSPTGYSFFSGHSASSFSITALMVLFLRKRFIWCWAFFVWPLIFATSRIYVGVHYPVDIMVGAVVGILTAFFFYGLYVRLIVPYLGLSHP